MPAPNVPPGRDLTLTQEVLRLFTTSVGEAMFRQPPLRSHPTESI